MILNHSINREISQGEVTLPTLWCSTQEVPILILSSSCQDTLTCFVWTLPHLLNLGLSHRNNPVIVNLLYIWWLITIYVNYVLPSFHVFTHSLQVRQQACVAVCLCTSACCWWQLSLLSPKHYEELQNYSYFGVVFNNTVSHYKTQYPPEFHACFILLV